ncbi:hypothetical protein EYF80_024439 [Liparis tanakae]|uniref:Uncharacterized protein n=1 Tax=Liparis tanakae TaxID=230148 RepID=A0A4Z2HJ57_9TELE|nr:hypothetical protein EYF80_024439 [Liparis tanakae]
MSSDADLYTFPLGSGKTMAKLKWVPFFLASGYTSFTRLLAGGNVPTGKFVCSVVSATVGGENTQQKGASLQKE